MLQVELLGASGVAEGLTANRSRSAGRDEFERSLTQARATSSRNDASRERIDPRTSRDASPDAENTGTRSDTVDDRWDDEASSSTPADGSHAAADATVDAAVMASFIVSGAPTVGADGAMSQSAHESLPTLNVESAPSTSARATHMPAPAPAASLVHTEREGSFNPGSPVGLKPTTGSEPRAANANLPPASVPVGASLDSASPPSATTSVAPEGALAAAKQFALLRTNESPPANGGAASVERAFYLIEEESEMPASDPAKAAAPGSPRKAVAGDPVTLPAVGDLAAADAARPAVSGPGHPPPDPGAVETRSSASVPTELSSPTRDGTARVEVLRVNNPQDPDVAELPPRVLRLVRQALRRGEPSLRIQLDPPQLGRVDVEFRVGRGRLGVRMEVDSPEVKAALLEDIDRLRESLAAFQAEPGLLEVEVRERAPRDDTPESTSRAGGRSSVEDPDDAQSEETIVAAPTHLGRQIDRKG